MDLLLKLESVESGNFGKLKLDSLNLQIPESKLEAEMLNVQKPDTESELESFQMLPDSIVLILTN